MNNEMGKPGKEKTQAVSAVEGEASNTVNSDLQAYSTLKYVYYFFFGVAYLCAWNVYISVPAYFQKMLKGSNFVDNFQNYFSVVYMLAMLISITLIVYLVKAMSLKLRIHVGFLLLNAVFIVTLSLSLLPSIEPNLYFFIVMLLITVAAVASTFLSSFYGYAANYNPIYTQAFSTGQGLGGALPSLYSFLLTLFQSSEDSSQGPTYFGIAVAISAMCYFFYFRLLKEDSKPTLYYPNSTSQTTTQAEPDIMEEADNKIAIKRIYGLAIGAGFNFLVTLALFPSITTNIISTTTDTFLARHLIGLHFLVFNIGDLIGKSLPGLNFFNLKSEKILLSAIFARIIYIALFLFCNVVVNDVSGMPLPRAIPSIFGDYAYLFILFTFAVTNGWFGTNVFMLAPSLCPNQSQRVGDVMVFGMTIGLTLGSVASFIIRSIFCQCNPFT